MYMTIFVLWPIHRSPTVATTVYRHKCAIEMKNMMYSYEGGGGGGGGEGCRGASGQRDRPHCHLSSSVGATRRVAAAACGMQSYIHM